MPTRGGKPFHAEMNDGSCLSQDDAAAAAGGGVDTDVADGDGEWGTFEAFEEVPGRRRPALSQKRSSLDTGSIREWRRSSLASLPSPKCSPTQAFYDDDDAADFGDLDAVWDEERPFWDEERPDERPPAARVPAPTARPPTPAGMSFCVRKIVYSRIFGPRGASGEGLRAATSSACSCAYCSPTDAARYVFLCT